jgi:hypothetical protein
MIAKDINTMKQFNFYRACEANDYQPIDDTEEHLTSADLARMQREEEREWQQEIRRLEI